MVRKSVAAVCAIAMGLTTVSATPARAMDASDTLAALLFGAAAIYIISEVGDDDDPKHQPDPEPAKVKHRHAGGLVHSHVLPHANHGHAHDHDAHPPRPHASKVLPRNCRYKKRIVLHNADADEVYYKASCLKTYPVAHGLPRTCRITVRGNGGDTQLYSSSCLKRYGYVRK